MLVRTKAVVIRTQKYGDTSVITKLYTKTNGLQTFMVKGVYRPKSRMPVSLFQPLQILDIQMYFRQTRNFQNLKEASPAYLPPENDFDMTRSAVSLFLTELLEHTLSGEEATNEGLFNFIERNLIGMHSGENLINLPLIFMIRLSKFLGIIPENNYEPGKEAFHIPTGGFTAWEEHNPQLTNPVTGKSLSKLLDAAASENNELQIPNDHKRKLLSALDNYFAYHLPGYKPLRSYKILTKIM